MRDDADFNTVFTHYYEQLYFFARRFVSDSSDCEDIVSEVFEEIWQNFSSIHLETLGSYLYTLVRRKCLDYLRHKKVKENYIRLCQKLSEPYTDEEKIKEMELREKVAERIIDALQPPETRKVFIECYVHRKKYREVSEELSMSMGMVKKHVMRALKIIRDSNTEKIIKSMTI